MLPNCSNSPSLSTHTHKNDKNKIKIYRTHGVRRTIETYKLYKPVIDKRVTSMIMSFPFETRPRARSQFLLRLPRSVPTPHLPHLSLAHADSPTGQFGLPRHTIRYHYVMRGIPEAVGMTGLWDPGDHVRLDSSILERIVDVSSVEKRTKTDSPSCPTQPPLTNVQPESQKIKPGLKPYKYTKKHTIVSGGVCASILPTLTEDNIPLADLGED